MSNLKAKLLAVFALFATMFALPSYAALDTGITTAVSAYQSDMLSVIGMLLAAGVAIWGARKLGQKMGWL